MENNRTFSIDGIAYRYFFLSGTLIDLQEKNQTEITGGGGRISGSSGNMSGYIDSVSSINWQTQTAYLELDNGKKDYVELLQWKLKAMLGNHLTFMFISSINKDEFYPVISYNKDLNDLIISGFALHRIVPEDRTKISVTLKDYSTKDYLIPAIFPFILFLLGISVAGFHGPASVFGFALLSYCLVFFLRRNNARDNIMDKRHKARGVVSRKVESEATRIFNQYRNSL